MKAIVDLVKLHAKIGLDMNFISKHTVIPLVIGASGVISDKLKDTWRSWM